MSAWFDHTAMGAACIQGVHTRVGVSPNFASFRIGVLRTHLLTGLLAHSAARSLGVTARVVVRWDDSDQRRSKQAHRQPLLRELTDVAHIPVYEPHRALRQQLRAHRYQQAVDTLAYRGFVRCRRGVPCLDVIGVERAMARFGVCPEEMTAKAAVNLGVPLRCPQEWVPLVRSDGRSLWHLATVVDDLDQGTTLIVRGNDKRAATAIQTRLRWALDSAAPVCAHVFVPKLLEPDGVPCRVVDLLDAGLRPSTLRAFLADPYTTETGSGAGFAALVEETLKNLPRHGDSRLDRAQLDSLDRKRSAVLDAHIAWQELKAAWPYAPSRLRAWIVENYPRPLLQQVRLGRALTQLRMPYEPAPDRAAEAWAWLAAWLDGPVQGPPPRTVRWILTGTRDGPEVGALLEVFPAGLIRVRLRLAAQELIRSRAARSRANVRSRPNSSRDSNRGRPTVRPVTATRTGA